MVREQSLLTAFCMSSFTACETTCCAGQPSLSFPPGDDLNDDLYICFAFAGYLQQIVKFMVLSII